MQNQTREGENTMNPNDTEETYLIEELESRLEMSTPTGDCTCHCTC